ncbi:MAG TPA: hypothetical protein VI384_04305 [Candidatus Dormibacteraeota bacterium]
MPRIGLKQLLSTLKDAGVRRYVHAGTEVEFFDGAPGVVPGETDRPDPELTRDTKAPKFRDPIAAAMADDLLDGEAEHN